MRSKIISRPPDPGVGQHICSPANLAYGAKSYPQQKGVRARIRNRDFNISDFGSQTGAFGPEDLDRLLEMGQITVVDSHRPPAVWWVNQGQSFREESAGGYLWAPQTTRAGYSVEHHTDLMNASVGDVVISYAQGAIRALEEVTAETVEHDRPDELPEGEWPREGLLTAAVSSTRMRVQYPRDP